MNRQYDLGVPLAEREIEFESGTGERTPVVIRLGHPVIDPTTPHESWICPVQIQGIGSQRVKGVFGVDAFQALLLAIHMIPLDLAHHQREHGGRFHFLGSTDASFVKSCRMAIEYAGDAFPPEAQ